MPRSASLLHAARTLKREDRLTELLAVVLRGHRGFAHLLLRAAGLPALGEVEVRTQLRTARGKFIDLQLVCLDSGGTVVSRLWSEHKTGSSYGRGQMEGYADDLDGFDGPAQLITVVDGLDEAPESPRWQSFTWRDIAMLAWHAGHDADGPTWRQAALSPDGPARQLLLLELLSYLEEQHGAVVSPVTDVHVVTLAQTGETFDTLSTLLELAADLSENEPDGDFGCDEDLSLYLQGFEAEGTWADPLDGYLELSLSGSDEWTREQTGEPAFGAGFNLPGDLEESLRSAARQPWRESLETQGVTVAELDGEILLYRTLYLADLVAEGPTLDAQAQALATWADESFAILAAHDPSVNRPVRVKRTRKKRTSRADEPDADSSDDASA